MDAEAIKRMNELRATQGLAPLPVPGEANPGPRFRSRDDASESNEDEDDDLSTLEKRAAAADNNWQKLENERLARLARDQRKEATKKARDQAARNERIIGKSLGEADNDGDLDVRSWLTTAKKRRKQIDKARKLEEELAAREQQAEYTASDLAGVKVGHEIDEFDETNGEQILTLKDAEIGEESEDDELENAELKAKDKLEEKLKLKKKRPDYDPTEQGEKRNILYKYDEELDGKMQKRFTLDGKGSSREAAKRGLNVSAGEKPKTLTISLEMLQDDTPVSDYVDPATIKVKKPKKQKKEKKTRKKDTAEDGDMLVPPPTIKSSNDAMDMEEDAHNEAPIVTRKPTLDFDDEDLQSRLAEQRRQVLKKRKRTDAAELLRQMGQEMQVDEESVEDGGMTIDETTEFVANLQTVEPEDTGVMSAPAIKSTEVPEDGDGDVDMAYVSYAGIEDEADRRERVKREVSTPADITATGLEAEETMADMGIAASLNMLRKRGLVSNNDVDNLTERERQRTDFLAAKQRFRDEFDANTRREREDDRRSGRFDHMSKRDRDAHQQSQNERREAYANQKLNEQFKKNYKPNVELKYIDEFGRSMNQKEAFKHLSHQFHGKGSGKLKTEKHLKKMEDEKKGMAKGVLNVGESEGGMMNVQGREGKRQKKAGVRLQ